MQTVVLYFQAENSRRPLGNITESGLRTEPAAPDPTKNYGEGQKAETKRQREKQHQVKLFYPQDLTKQVQAEVRNVDSQQTCTVVL